MTPTELDDRLQHRVDEMMLLEDRANQRLNTYNELLEKHRADNAKTLSALQQTADSLSHRCQSLQCSYHDLKALTQQVGQLRAKDRWILCLGSLGGAVIVFAVALGYVVLR